MSTDAYAHNEAEITFRRRGRLLLGAILALTAALAAMTTAVDLTAVGWRVAAVAMTVLIAVLSAMGFHLDYTARAVDHHVTARQFQAIRRAIEELESANIPSEVFRDRVTEIRRMWDAASSRSPNVPWRAVLRAEGRSHRTAAAPIRHSPWLIAGPVGLALVVLFAGKRSGSTSARRP